MKLYDEYYITQRKESELAYLLPLHKNNFEVQKAKGDRWACYEDNESGFTYKNIPTSGYKIIGFSDRYSTSNKHIYIQHPDGFHFEMAVETFVELVKEVNIKESIIQDELIVYHYNGKNALCKNDGVLYKSLEIMSDDNVYKITDVNVGDIVMLPRISNLKNEVVYVGLYNVNLDLCINYNIEELNKVKETKGTYWAGNTDVEKRNLEKSKNVSKAIHLFLIKDYDKTDKEFYNIIGYSKEKFKKLKPKKIIKAKSDYQNNINQIEEVFKQRNTYSIFSMLELSSLKNELQYNTLTELGFINDYKYRYCLSENIKNIKLNEMDLI